MPSIGFGEILVILVVALLVFGPKKLPEVGRSVGRALREFKRTSDEVRSEFSLSLDDDDEMEPSALPTAAAPDPAPDAETEPGPAPAPGSGSESPDAGEERAPEPATGATPGAIA